MVRREGMLYAVNEFVPAKDGEEVLTRTVRYRTMGDANLTAAVAVRRGQQRGDRRRDLRPCG